MGVPRCLTHVLPQPPTPMLKRFILCLLLILSLAGADPAKAANPYRSYADAYLQYAADYALEAYKTSDSSTWEAAFYAYLWSIYAKYNGQVSAWLTLHYGNTTITDLYDYYSYLFSSYSLSYAQQLYLTDLDRVNLTTHSLATTYYSYLCSYYANLYAYYAYVFK